MKINRGTNYADGSPESSLDWMRCDAPLDIKHRIMSDITMICLTQGKMQGWWSITDRVEQEVPGGWYEYNIGRSEAFVEELRGELRELAAEYNIIEEV